MNGWLIIACTVMLGCLALPALSDEQATTRARLASPVTHSDWMVRDPSPAWGPEGVRQILDRCKSCGWSRVYWRCFDGGKALYGSKLMEPYYKYDEVNYHKDHGSEWVLERLAPCDYRKFDSFAEAVRYGHEIGLEVHAWLSINEDDHGYGLVSRFTNEHPETRWVRRDGRPYNSQVSFAFPKARAYKLALVREIMAYGPDGIFFDWIRTGDVRDNPHTDSDGVANYGYEAPNVERFKRKFGVDPHDIPNGDERWVAARAYPQTVFMREASRIVRDADPDAMVSAMVHNLWGYRGGPNDTRYAGNLRGLLLDVTTWAREGLIDEIVAAGYYLPGGNAELAWKSLREETEGRADVWLFGWVGSAEQFQADTALAEKLAAPQILLWESDYIALPPAKADVVKVMSEYAGE